MPAGSGSERACFARNGAPAGPGVRQRQPSIWVPRFRRPYPDGNTREDVLSVNEHSIDDMRDYLVAHNWMRGAQLPAGSAGTASPDDVHGINAGCQAAAAKDHDSYQQAFQRLLRDLKADEK